MRKSLKFLLAVFLFMSSSLLSWQIAEASTVEEGYIYFEQLNESTLKLHIENGTSYINEDGIAFVEDNITKEVAELPAKGIDKNGAPVYFVYKADGNDLIVEYHLMIQARGFWKCTLGTVGAAGTGALAGMGIGAVAATPVTVLGGGVFGGVFGGMAGASASCF